MRGLESSIASHPRHRLSVLDGVAVAIDSRRRFFGEGKRARLHVTEFAACVRRFPLKSVDAGHTHGVHHQLTADRMLAVRFFLGCCHVLLFLLGTFNRMDAHHKGMECPLWRYWGGNAFQRLTALTRKEPILPIRLKLLPSNRCGDHLQSTIRRLASPFDVLEQPLGTRRCIAL